MKVRPQFFSLNVKQNAAWSYFRQFDRQPVLAYKILVFRGRPRDLIKKPFPFFELKFMKWIIFWTVRKDMKVNIIFAVE